jgi:hypothetical protein
MNQFQDNPWRPVCPLSPTGKPAADLEFLPGREGSAALPPLEAGRDQAPQPPTLLEDDYQWMALL